MVDDSTVFTDLSSLDVKKATGPDQLSPRFLKNVASEIVIPLTNLFHYSLQHKNYSTGLEGISCNTYIRVNRVI